MNIRYILILIILTVLTGCSGSGSNNQTTENQVPVGPSIITHPSDQTVTEGQQAVFTVTASGTEPLSYQWRKNGVNISGATSASYTTAATTLADNGNTYDCVVSNTVGSVTSNTAALFVTSMETIFSDDFSTDTTGEYTIGGDAVADFVYDGSGQRAQVLTEDNIGLIFSRALSPLDTGVFSIDFLPTRKYPIGGKIYIRLMQDSNNYYEIINSDGYGPIGITKVVDGQVVDSEAFSSEYSQGVNYAITVSFSPGWLTVEAFGDTVSLVTETQALTVTRFEVELGQQDAYVDNISCISGDVFPAAWDDDFSSDTVDHYEIIPTLYIGGIGQFNYDSDWNRAGLLTGDNIGLMFSRTVTGLDSGNFSIEFHPSAKYSSGGGFYLRLKENDSNFYEIYNTDGLGPGVVKKVINDQEVETATFQNQYSQDVNYHVLVNFSPGHTKVIAFGEVFTFETDNAGILVNTLEIELRQQDGYFDNIRYEDVLNDYYVAIGDSITKASFHDDIPSDGIGFEPILANLLLELKEYPHTVINEGVSGHTSADGLSLLPTILEAHPQARYFLIQYGTNDAWIPVPSGQGLTPGHPDYPGTLKDNMQQIIDLIKANGKIPLLAKVPIAFEPRSYINGDLQDYNLVVDELVFENKISVIPPDFYCFFENHPEQMDDDIHPDGLGYDSMANIWRDVLTDQYGGCL